LSTQSQDLAQECPTISQIFTVSCPKANKQWWQRIGRILPTGVYHVKQLSILVPAIAAGILVSSLVLAAPQTAPSKVMIAKAPDRAEAYRIAMAD
jgi:hypothetical protein